MKKTLSRNVLKSLLFMLLLTAGSNVLAQVRQKTTKTIAWKPEMVTKYGESETIKLLNFEGAVYDGSRNSLPYYTERIPFGFPGDQVSVRLINAVYEPFSTSLPLDYSKIGSEPLIEASVMTERKSKFTGITMLPLRMNAAKSLERLVSFDFEITPLPAKAVKSSGQQTFAASSVLASGNWYKLAVNGSGLHLINAAILRQCGLEPSLVDPNRLRVFGNGGGMLPFLNSEFRHDDLVENAIFVGDGGTPGVFDETDFAIFYGEAPTTWKYDTSDGRFHHQQHIFSDYSCYFITPDANTGTAPKRVQSIPSSPLPVTHTTSTFDDYKVHETDRINFIKSGRQWYGEQFDVNLTQTFNFTFNNIDVTVPVYVKSYVAAHSFAASSFRMNYGSQQLLQHQVPLVPGGYTSDYANDDIRTATFTAINGNIPLTLTYYPSTSTSIGFLNYIEVNARRNLVMSASQMHFRDMQSVGPGNVTRFNLSGGSNVKVLDITDPTDIKLQQFDSGTSFVAQTDELKNYLAYDGTSFLTPVALGNIVNQNLHAYGQVDMIIVSHIGFLTEAMRLADFHRSNSNLRVAVVTPEQVYNEFSSGVRDIIGIRDFVKMFYKRATTPDDMPKYLLLFGDGSYDNKGASSNTNYIPTYQSLNSTSLTQSYVSDDFYGFLDDHEGSWEDTVTDLLDIGVGRFPVKSIDEAAIVVSKTIDYATPGTVTDATVCAGGNTTSLGDWRNILCFVADDEDSGLHLLQSNDLTTYLKNNHPVYNIDKIFIDSYSQLSTPGGQRYPTANDAITRRVEKGALIVNYTGHGGETGWAGERILDNAMIQSWQNIRKLPLFITATCEFSRYDDPARTSAGELILINSEAGGIALMTTTRLVYASQNEVINEAMIHALFENVNGERPRLGDIYMKVKNDNLVMQGAVNPRNFSLLGDPAIMLAYPKHEVVTTLINGNPVLTDADTLGALSKVTITGEIRSNGQKLTNFNGIIYPTVFDKEETISTLVNDPTSLLVNFKLQKNILYKGKASVKNGDFSYTFIVPKDIAYQVGRGRLSYYAHNGDTDASGYYDSLLIGGTSNSTVTDVDGPVIKLYMNDEKFVFGGTTDENPIIYALLADTNGINTVGNGIGHDITARLDGKADQIFVLNDYYEANLDSYQSGRVAFPLSGLADGRHTLDFKVWDIYNNSSEARTEFVVAESSTLALNHVLNYPNPFTTKTSFFFEHNRPCNTLDVQIQIYTVSGKLIKTLTRSVTCEGYRVDDLDWDGRDDFGDPIGRGVYVYRLKIRDSEGATAEKYEKLVVLK